MENIIKIFRNLMIENNYKEILNYSIIKDGQLVFSAVQNISDKYNLFLSESHNLFTIQQCYRTTDKIMSIIGMEGVATPFTHMMSFFQTKTNNLENALQMVFDFYERLHIQLSEVTIAISESIYKLIEGSLKASVKVCFLQRESLKTYLGDDKLRGEYIKFYFRNNCGLVPIGSLNVITNGIDFAIDSSFLYEPLLVVSTNSRCLYDSAIFSNTLSLIDCKRIYENVELQKYRLMNISRVIVALIDQHVYPSCKSVGYVTRKFIRTIVVDSFLYGLQNKKLDFVLQKGKEYLYDILIAEMKDLEENGCLLNKEKIDITEIVFKEVINYFNVLNNFNAKLNSHNETRDVKILIEEKGYPVELLKYYSYDGLEMKYNITVPMNPLFENIEYSTNVWIKKLHEA